MFDLQHSCLFHTITAEEYAEHQRAFHVERQRAIIAAHGKKERFDFGKFASLYHHDTGDCRPLRPDAPAEVQDHYKHMYYKYPDRTIREYAQRLNDMDATA